MGDGNAAKSSTPFSLALIAGGCAGTSVDIALYPLDTLRTRLQSEQGFLKAGGFKGAYRGVLSAAIGSAPGAAAFFSTYETMKGVIKTSSGGEERWWHHSTASSCGEVAACFIRVPTDNIKQNMQVGKYETLTVALRSISAGGVGGFYTGYLTTVAREIPFSFIQFPLYEGFKKGWSAYQGYETTALQGAACGSCAGAIAAAITTPLDVAKTRIMLDGKGADVVKKYTGTLQTLRTIAGEEGFPALFNGITPRVGWITVGGFIFFGAYEKATSLLWRTGIW